MMLTIIATIAICYIAAGIYVMLVFDHADENKGYDPSELWTQIHTVATWPGFLFFIAHEDEYVVEIGDE